MSTCLTALAVLVAYALACFGLVELIGRAIAWQQRRARDAARRQ